MIKLCIEDATLATLDPALLPFVQWKGLKVSDMEGVSEEVISQNLFKMNSSVIKSLVKNNRVQVTNLTNEQWYELTTEMHQSGTNIFDIVQMPYRALKYILEQNYAKNRYALAIARTQQSLPVQDALGILDISSLNEVLYTNSTPALVDYMFTEEGIKVLKDKNSSVTNLIFITTDEAKKLGLTGKNAQRNRTIDPRILRRAGACDAGSNYCNRILKELGVERITWNEAIMAIRNSPKLQNRDSLRGYMNWIRNNSEVM